MIKGEGVILLQAWGLETPSFYPSFLEFCVGSPFPTSLNDETVEEKKSRGKDSCILECKEGSREDQTFREILAGHSGVGQLNSV